MTGTRTRTRGFFAGMLALLTAVAAPPAAAETVVHVPAAANASGRGGTYWRTLLELTNPDAARDIDVSVAFLAAGADNRGARATTVRVPARRTIVVPDVVGSLGGSGGGALRLTSASVFHVSSRTETARPGGLPAGVEVPGEEADRAAAAGVVMPLANRPGEQGVRANVGFLNTSASAVKVSLRLLDAQLAELGATDVALPPLGFQQLSDVFGLFGAASLAIDDARLSYAATGPVHAFGIVVSNATGDGTLVAASPGATAVRGLALTRVASVTRVPDATYRTGNFCRLNPLPGTTRLILTFGTGDYTKVGPGPGGCANAGMGYAWKELTADLAETGRAGTFRSYPGSCAAGDAASVLVGSDYYFLTGGPGGLTLARYDIATFTKLGERAIPLRDGVEASNDQMLAYVNGHLDASALLAPASNAEVDPYQGFGTYHKLFALDLAPVGEKNLTDPPHINGSSMLFEAGAYHLVTSTAFWGDLLALRYDTEYRLLSRTVLASRGQWSQGALFDGTRFWVTWVDVSRKGTSNIALAAFDRDWNPISRVPVTAFTARETTSGGRPGLLRVGNRLYVSYDVDGLDPATHEERKAWSCDIAIYEY